MPEVLLGIYAMDELQHVVVQDVTRPMINAFSDDDLPEAEAVYEPSGGFATEKAEKGLPDSQVPASAPTEAKAAFDDPMAFFEEARAHVRKIEGLQQLRSYFDATEPDRRRLFDVDPVSSRELDEAFTSRGVELQPRARGNR